MVTSQSQAIEVKPAAVAGGLAQSVSCQIRLSLPKGVFGGPVPGDDTASKRLFRDMRDSVNIIVNQLSEFKGLLYLLVNARYIENSLPGEVSFEEKGRVARDLLEPLKQFLRDGCLGPRRVLSRHTEEVGSLDIDAYFIPNAVEQLLSVLGKLDEVERRGPATLEEAAEVLVPLADEFLDIVAERVGRVLSPLKDKRYATTAERQGACNALRRILDAYRRGLQDPKTGDPAKPYGRGVRIELDTPDVRGGTTAAEVVPGLGSELVAYPLPESRRPKRTRNMPKP